MMNNSYDKHDKQEGHSPLQKHLEEQFGQIRSEAPIPEKLKEEVFNSLDTLHLVADIIDLFTVKFTKTESEFLDLFQEESRDEKWED